MEFRQCSIAGEKYIEEDGVLMKFREDDCDRQLYRIEALSVLTAYLLSLIGAIKSFLFRIFRTKWKSSYLLWLFATR